MLQFECCFCMSVHNRNCFGFAIFSCNRNHYRIRISSYPCLYLHRCFSCRHAIFVTLYGRSHCDSISSHIIQFEMAFRYNNQVHHTIQTAIECKVCFLWIHIIIVCIIQGNCQHVFFLQLICQIHTECRISTLVMCHCFSVQIDICNYRCTKEFHIYLTSCFEFRFLKFCHIPAGTSVVVIATVLSVYGIPCVWQTDRSSFFRRCIFCILCFFYKHPVVF